jgi:hypothetical protein
MPYVPYPMNFQEVYDIFKCESHVTNLPVTNEGVEKQIIN